MLKIYCDHFAVYINTAQKEYNVIASITSQEKENVGWPKVYSKWKMEKGKFKKANKLFVF